MRTLIANGDHEPTERAEQRTERLETEFKYRLTSPAALAELVQGTEALDIHQLYLSRPDEPCSLRLRRSTDAQGRSTYEACLKSRGDLTPNGLARMESTVAIDAATFAFYEPLAPAQLRKQRYEPVPGVTVDLIDGLDQPQVEIEDMFMNQDAFELFSAFADVLDDVTSRPEGDNEALAYQLAGIEATGEQQRETEELFQEIMAHRAFHPKGLPLVVTLSGRSGSGKSTVAGQLEWLIRGNHPDLTVTTLSTDDYHRGKQRLERDYGRPCTNWDEYAVYNTNLLAFDLWELSQGRSIDRRRFDFRTQEVAIGEPILPADIILVEGIVAHTPDLDAARHRYFDIGTPLATCLGRDMERIRQDTRGNGGIGNQLDRLAYIIETGEPTYQQQRRHIRNPFSASVRP